MLTKLKPANSPKIALIPENKVPAAVDRGMVNILKIATSPKTTKYSFE